MTPYYDEDGITIYHGGCRDVLAGSGQRFDMVFTSPPYNLGISSGGGLKASGNWSGNELKHGYEGHDDAMPLDEYEQWQRWVLLLLWSRLSPAGAIFYNHKPRVQNGELWMPTILNPCLPLRQIVIWSRAGGLNFSRSFYVPTHEWIMIFARRDWRLQSAGMLGLGDVWEVKQEHGNPHPAPFPVGLPARAIESAAPSSVLDPFMGSGTTLVAAKSHGCRAVGIDISERYCEIAAMRLAQGVLDFGAAS